MAGAFSPFINAWPADVKTDFISGANFLKSWYKGDVEADTQPLMDFVKNITSYPTERVLLVGTGFNGVIARSVAMRIGNVPSVSIGAPGMKWVRSKLRAPYPTSPWLHHDLTTDCDALKQIDEKGDDATVYYLRNARSKNDGLIDPVCGRPDTIVRTLLATCGDSLGRQLTPGFRN
jgi:hypothetical protein